MRQLTLWMKADEYIYSEYGVIPQRQWVDNELKRLSKGETPNTYFLKRKYENDAELISIWTTKKAPKDDYKFKFLVSDFNRAKRKRKDEMR